MKKIEIEIFRFLGKKRKLLRIMKLTFILLTAIFVQVSASVYSQATKFSFDVKNSRVEDILREIENKSEFRFFYQREQVDVERKIDLNVQNETVEKILEKLFTGQDVLFDVRQDNLILIKTRNAQAGTNSSSFWASQQQKTVTGIVTDQTGQPLPGVTVIIKGTTQGVVSDVNGNFSIPNIPNDATLQFSFVGMKTQEFLVSGKQVINVTMQEESLGLDEVIVIGYGTAKRQDFTGSVSSLKMENSAVSLLPNQNALESLKGTFQD